MKKNEMKAGGKKPPEVRSREQMEDRAFNRMLLWLVAVAAVEVVMLLINSLWSFSFWRASGMRSIGRRGEKTASDC